MNGPPENGKAPEVLLGGGLQGFPRGRFQLWRVSRTTTHPVRIVKYAVFSDSGHFFFETGWFRGNRNRFFFRSPQLVGGFRDCERGLQTARPVLSKPGRFVAIGGFVFAVRHRWKPGVFL